MMSGPQALAYTVNAWVPLVENFINFFILQLPEWKKCQINLSRKIEKQVPYTHTRNHTYASFSSCIPSQPAEAVALP